jgi:hypothetical protein
LKMIRFSSRQDLVKGLFYSLNYLDARPWC